MKKINKNERISKTIKEYKLSKKEIEYINKLKSQLASGGSGAALVCHCDG